VCIALVTLLRNAMHTCRHTCRGAVQAGDTSNMDVPRG
jgi:hypothetical protein